MAPWFWICPGVASTGVLSGRVFSLTRGLLVCWCVLLLSILVFSLPPFVRGLSAALLVGRPGCRGLLCIGGSGAGGGLGLSESKMLIWLWRGSVIGGLLLFVASFGGLWRLLGCTDGGLRGSGGSPCGLAGGALGLAVWSWAWRMVRAVEGARVSTVISHP